MLSCFRYTLIVLLLSSLFVSCSGKEEEPTLDRFALLKEGMEWEKEQWRKEGIKEKDFKDAKAKNPKFEPVLADGIGKGPMCSWVKKYDIKFPLNLLRHRVQKKEIISDFQLKLESNFMMYFDEDVQPSDVFFNIDDLFLMRADIDRFIFTIQGIAARLYQ